MNELIEIKVQTTDQGRCLVSVAGDLDVVTAPEVRLALHAAIDHHDWLVVDLSRLHFFDCAGLTALLAANRTARAKGYRAAAARRPARARPDHAPDGRRRSLLHRPAVMPAAHRRR
ncbi:STAS domain-containing protein [Streptomyces sp. x-45]|uniref:STAS domain-containing protein n=1 Tax=Streptomyces sp. x-45 TaxID=2789281 RepID=UPI00398036AA